MYLKRLLPFVLASLTLADVRQLLPPEQIKAIERAQLSVNSIVSRRADEYMVTLESGYTVDEHIKTVGFDLATHIKQRWDDPEVFTEFTYWSHLSNWTALDLVRRDPGVIRIEQAAGYPEYPSYDGLEPGDPNYHLFEEQQARFAWRDSKPVHPALENDGFVMRKIPHHYDVHLKGGYSSPSISMQNYFRRLGKDWMHRTSHREEGYYTSFLIRLDEEADVELVRTSADVRCIFEHAEYLPHSYFAAHGDADDGEFSADSAAQGTSRQSEDIGRDEL